MLKVRQMLTDILLTVTNEEIRAVAREALLDSRGLSSIIFKICIVVPVDL